MDEAKNDVKNTRHELHPPAQTLGFFEVELRVP
jgi:hypothetical protein